MGKTHRKTKHFTSREAYIQDFTHREWIRRQKTLFKWEKKPKDLYHQECVAARENYNILVDHYNRYLEFVYSTDIPAEISDRKMAADWDRSKEFPVRVQPWLYHVSKSHKVEIAAPQTYDEVYDEMSEEYGRWYDVAFRDKNNRYYGRRQSFRKYVAEKVRVSNRINAHKVLRGSDTENLIWYDRADGKAHIYDFY